MKQLLRTELLKQRTTRTFTVGVAAAPIIGGLVTLAVYQYAGTGENDPLGAINVVHAVGAPAGVINVLALLLGVIAMAGEYRHETITTTFLAARRRDVVGAKLVALGLTGAFMAVLSMVGAVAVAVPWLASIGADVRVDGEVLRVAAGLVVSSALYGALGVAVGALVRNPTVAASTVLIWLLAGEGIIGDLFPGSTVVDWLPAAAARAMVRVGSGAGEPSAAAGATVLVGLVMAVSTLAAAATVRRDVT